MSNTELPSSFDELSLYPPDIPTAAKHFMSWAATTQRGPWAYCHLLRASVNPASTVPENPCRYRGSGGLLSPLPCSGAWRWTTGEYRGIQCCATTCTEAWETHISLLTCWPGLPGCPRGDLVCCCRRTREPHRKQKTPTRKVVCFFKQQTWSHPESTTNSLRRDLSDCTFLTGYIPTERWVTPQKNEENYRWRSCSFSPVLVAWGSVSPTSTWYLRSERSWYLSHRDDWASRYGNSNSRCQTSAPREEAAVPCIRGDREGKRRIHFLVAAENQHTDGSPKHKTLAKEKHGSWTISRGALEMLLL